MTISVIITSYNQKEYLVEAIESVLAQTVPCRDIIVVDDASTDGSPAVVRDYAARFPDRVRGFCHETNLGIPRNRNFALERVRGEYVAILDGDDRFLPHKNESELAVLQLKPECAAVYSNYWYMDGSGRRLNARYRRPQPSGHIFPEVFAGKFGMLRAMLIRTDALRAVGYLAPEFWHYDGFDLAVRLAHNFPLVYHADHLAEIRIHHEGASGWRTRRHEYSDLQGIYSRHQPRLEHLPPRTAARIERYWRAMLQRMAAGAQWQDGHRLAAMRCYGRALGQSPLFVIKTSLQKILPRPVFLFLAEWYHRLWTRHA